MNYLEMIGKYMGGHRISGTTEQYVEMTKHYTERADHRQLGYLHPDTLKVLRQTVDESKARTSGLCAIPASHFPNETQSGIERMIKRLTK